MMIFCYLQVVQVAKNDDLLDLQVVQVAKNYDLLDLQVVQVAKNYDFLLLAGVFGYYLRVLDGAFG